MLWKGLVRGGSHPHVLPHLLCTGCGNGQNRTSSASLQEIQHDGLNDLILCQLSFSIPSPCLQKLRFDLLDEGGEGGSEEGSASEDIPCIEDIPSGNNEDGPALQPHDGSMTDTSGVAVGAAGEKVEEQPADVALACDGESEGSGVVVGRAGEEVEADVKVGADGQVDVEGGLGGEEGVESCSSDDEEGQATDLVLDGVRLVVLRMCSALKLRASGDGQEA